MAIMGGRQFKWSLPAPEGNAIRRNMGLWKPGSCTFEGGIFSPQVHPFTSMYPIQREPRQHYHFRHDRDVRV